MARRSIEDMFGEGLREVGELVLVFAILDKVIRGDITPWWTVAAIAVASALFLMGCYIERRRPDV